jgi:hypothetical protein
VILIILSNFAALQQSKRKFMFIMLGLKSLRHLWERRDALWYEGVDLEYPWTASAHSGTVAEILLQFVGVVYGMETWLCIPHGYYMPPHWMIFSHMRFQC